MNVNECLLSLDINLNIKAERLQFIEQKRENLPHDAIFRNKCLSKKKKIKQRIKTYDKRKENIYLLDLNTAAASSHKRNENKIKCKFLFAR